MAHRISNTKLEELIVQHKGFVTRICKSAGISRAAFYKRLKSYPKLQTKFIIVEVQVYSSYGFYSYIFHG